MPLILYGLAASPPCRTVLIVAEALGLQLELKYIDLTKGDHLTPEFLKINPLHKVPTLDDNGTILGDSHAISAYLVAKYGKDDSLYPKDLVKKALVDARLHFDTGYAFSSFGKVFRANMFGEQKEILTTKQIEELEDMYGFLNTYLTNNKWLIGDTLTIADIALFATITSSDVVLPVDDSKFPHVRRWLNNGKKLPLFKINDEGLEVLRRTWIEITAKK